MKTILVATDGSEAAEDALEVAIELAREAGAKLEVLSVQEPLPHGRAGSGPPMLEVEQPHGAEHIAEAAAQKARDAGVEATPHAPRGEVADVLAGAATKLGADLMVVGSRGHGPLAGAVLGSVSHALVSRSPVPLTIVRHGAAGSLSSPST